MELKTIFKVSALTSAMILAGCGGDVNLQPTNIDNSVDNSVSTGGSTGTNPCASYSKDETTYQGTYDGVNCTYASTFVGKTTPLTVDVTIPVLTNGVHIFQDSLFVGEDSADASQATASGTGPKLTIAAGSTIAFTESQDYVRIARGSQIIANGTASAPITFTSYSDAVEGSAAADAVSLWGGIMINGWGITNNCSDDQRTNNTCSVKSEGQESYYGGNNNEDNSGVLKYVVVKHSGFAVTEGDELNGVTFNAVGSGTTVDYLQVYNTYDDGLEFFGGAVDVSHFVGVNVLDDSLDFSDGYQGRIQYALIKHKSDDGNRCIEGDNMSDSRVSSGAIEVDASWAATPITNPTVANMTCITSGNDGGTHGDSEGIVLRRGIQANIINSMITSPESGNECLELGDVIEGNAGDEFETATSTNANNGSLTITSTILACAEPVKDTGAERLVGGASQENWFLAGANNLIIADTATAGSPTVLAGNATVTNLLDETGGAVVTPASTTGVTGITDTDYIGALEQGGTDWTADWTVGL